MAVFTAGTSELVTDTLLPIGVTCVTLHWRVARVASVVSGRSGVDEEPSSVRAPRKTSYPASGAGCGRESQLIVVMLVVLSLVTPQSNAPLVEGQFVGDVLLSTMSAPSPV